MCTANIRVRLSRWMCCQFNRFTPKRNFVVTHIYEKGGKLKNGIYTTTTIKMRKHSRVYIFSSVLNNESFRECTWTFPLYLENKKRKQQKLVKRFVFLGAGDCCFLHFVGNYWISSYCVMSHFNDVVRMKGGNIDCKGSGLFSLSLFSLSGQWLNSRWIKRGLFHVVHWWQQWDWTAPAGKWPNQWVNRA